MDFSKKESSEFISATFERKHFEAKFTNTEAVPKKPKNSKVLV